MKRTLTALGLTVGVISFGTALATAQDRGAAAQGQGNASATAAQEQVQPRAQGRGGAGPGAGPAQGVRPRTGAGQTGRQGMLGRGRGMMGAGPAAQGRGRGMAGRGQAMQGRGPAFSGRGGPAGLAALNLTDDQRTQIASLHRTERDQGAPLQDQLDVARKALHRELFADRRDSRKINDLAGTVARLERQLADLHIRTTTGVADVLTAEQRETMRLRGERGGIGRGPGAGGPGARGGGGLGPRFGGR